MRRLVLNAAVCSSLCLVPSACPTRAASNHAVRASSGSIPPAAAAIDAALADLPRTCEGAVSRLLATMKPELKASVRSTPKDELIVFHDNWGMGIRNSFGLWGDNPQLLASCAASANPRTTTDPDAISAAIIELVWERLQSMDGGDHGD